ncbi:MAG: hypothetical protein IPH60_15205 [Flavobacteriales bacterium]|nr:hypothetical protein [Flavobacteriales bacterium]
MDRCAQGAGASALHGSGRGRHCRTRGKKRPDSDADFAVYQKIEGDYEPNAENYQVLRSDEGSTAERIAQALAYMQPTLAPMTREQIHALMHTTRGGSRRGPCAFLLLSAGSPPKARETLRRCDIARTPPR